MQFANDNQNIPIETNWIFIIISINFFFHPLTYWGRVVPVNYAFTGSHNVAKVMWLK